MEIGIGAGFVAFVFIKVIRGKARELHPLMWGIAAAFILYFAQGVIATFLK